MFEQTYISTADVIRGIFSELELVTLLTIKAEIYLIKCLW